MVADEADVPIDERTLGQVLACRAIEFGNKPLIISPDGDSTSYLELHEVSNRIARGIVALGIKHQERVLVMMPDVIDNIRVWCGLAKRGAVEVPVNHAYRGDVLAHIVNDSTARTIVVDRGFLDRLEDICDQLKFLERCIIYTENAAEGGTVTLPPKLAARCDSLPFDGLLSANTASIEPGPAYDDLVTISYTSGTTGPSKGVMVSHAHAFADAHACAYELYAIKVTDVIYSPGLPLFHMAAKFEVVFAAMISGTSAVLRKGYKNEYFWADIKKYGCTVTTVASTHVNFLVKAPEQADDADNPLERMVVGPLIPECELFAKRFGVQICTAYGGTEQAVPILHPPGEPFPSLRCIGRPRRGVHVKIFDDHDREVPVGELGEICVRPTESWELMVGYWRRPEATAKAFRNLWYHTGDSGYQDAEGRFYFVDRKGDSMRRRGENISSIEVEDQINAHPLVLECAAFPVWADEGEQEVMATILPKSGATIDPVKMIRYLNGRMAYFMVPRFLDFVLEMPHTPTGKIRKGELRERGVTERTWDRVAAGVRLRK